MGLFSRRAFSNASGPHGYQSTGVCACCRREGLFSLARRLVYMTMGEEAFDFEMLDPGRDRAVRPWRQESDGLAAGAHGQTRHGHRRFDHGGESVRQDDSAELGGEGLQTLRLGE